MPPAALESKDQNKLKFCVSKLRFIGVASSGYMFITKAKPFGFFSNTMLPA